MHYKEKEIRNVPFYESLPRRQSQTNSELTPTTTITVIAINIIVFLYNYCCDDIEINMKSYILYKVY